MKPLFLILGLLVIISCEPSIYNEGVTFEPIDFSFKLKEDTAIQNLGDTIFLRSSKLNEYNLNDGKLLIFMSIAYFNVDTIKSPDDVKRAYENKEYNIVFHSGTYNNHSTGFLREIILYPKGEDSLYFDIEFIPLKKGIYKFVFKSSFYEGKDGKARTNAKFDVINPNWEFYDSSLGPTPNPTDDNYYRAYLFRVE